jgi:AmpD protein
MHIKNGWLELDEQVDSPSKQNKLCHKKNYYKKYSPHCDERPDENDISLLVIHNISLPPSEFQHNYVEDFFMGKLDPKGHPYFKEIASLRVSSHLYIRRNGLIIQFVPFHKRAWHAGVSVFDGREACNDFSIGIELEGQDDLAYSQEQYQSLIQVTKNIMSTYPLINQRRITGHSDIAPGRKTDPGPAFDWRHYLSAL